MRPRALSERAVRRLLWLSEQVPPRVHAANVRLHLNGWHTNNRYQNKSKTPCYVCGNLVLDSIEHFLHCQSIRQIFLPRWRGDVAKCFFLAGPSEADILLSGMLVYGIYSFHCFARHSTHPTHIESTAGIMRLIGEVSWSQRASKLLWEHERELNPFRRSLSNRAVTS